MEENDDSWTLVDKDGFELENSACQTEHAQNPTADEMQQSDAQITPAATNDVGEMIKQHSRTASTASKSSIDTLSDGSVDVVNTEEQSSAGCSYPLEFTLGSDPQYDLNHDSFESDDSDLSIIDGGDKATAPVSDLDGNPDLQALLAAFKAKFCHPPVSQPPGSLGHLPSDVSLATFSDDLPVNFVQMCSNRMRNYIHTYNSPLNWKLTLLVSLATATCLGLGIGHFVGQTSSWLIRRAKSRNEEFRQGRQLLTNLKTCQANLANVTMRHSGQLDQLQRDLTTCRFKHEHRVASEDSYCRKDDLAVRKQESACQTEVSELRTSVDNKQLQVARLKQQVESLAAELVFYSQAHRESVGRISQVQTSEQSLDRRLRKFFRTLDSLFDRNGVAPLDNWDDSTLSSETKLLQLEAQILHMVAQFERQITRLNGDLIDLKTENFERSLWLNKLLQADKARASPMAVEVDIPEKTPTIMPDSDIPQTKSVRPFGQFCSYLLGMSDRLKTQFSAYTWLLANLTFPSDPSAAAANGESGAQSDSYWKWMVEKLNSVKQTSASVSLEDSAESLVSWVRKGVEKLHPKETESLHPQAIVQPIADLAQKSAKNIGDLFNAVWTANNEKIATLQRSHQRLVEKLKESMSQRVQKGSLRWDKLKSDWMDVFNKVFWSATDPAVQQDDFEFDMKSAEPEKKPVEQDCPAAETINNGNPSKIDVNNNNAESWLFQRSEMRRKQRVAEWPDDRKNDWFYKRSKGRREQRKAEEKRRDDKVGWVFKRGRGRDFYRRWKG